MLCVCVSLSLSLLQVVNSDPFEQDIKCRFCDASIKCIDRAPSTISLRGSKHCRRELPAYSRVSLDRNRRGVARREGEFVATFQLKEREEHQTGHMNLGTIIRFLSWKSRDCELNFQNSSSFVLSKSLKSITNLLFST